MRLNLESVRARLTIFYVVVLGIVLLVVGGLIYILLARALYARIDESLLAVMQIAAKPAATTRPSTSSEAARSRNT